MWSNPRARAAADCRKMDQGDVREEMGGKCLWRKARQPWEPGDRAESCIGGGAISITTLSPRPASAAEN